jgi:hypothetical protein
VISILTAKRESSEVTMRGTFAAIAIGTLAAATAHAQALRPSDGSDTLACAGDYGTTRISPGAAAAMSPYVLEKLRQKDEATRQRSQVICERIKREHAEKQRQYDDEMAKQRAAALEYQRQQAERGAKFEADRKEEARQAALPINRLLTSYRLFHYVSVCNEVREGYFVKYVNDVELERARKVVKAIANQATKDDSSIDTDYVWQQAIKSTFPQVNDVVCRNSLVQLINSSPTSVWNVEKP